MKKILFFSFFTISWSANRVYWQNHDWGVRIVVIYTIPEELQWRESYVDFPHGKGASEFYYDLLKGGEFYEWNKTKKIKFLPNAKEPSPW